MTAFLAYVPVLHQGYLQFFQRHPEVKVLYLIGPEFLNQYRAIQKDLRALSPEQMKTIIESLHHFEKVEILEGQIAELDDLRIISPDEDISREFIQKYFPNSEVKYDNIFLRWDKTKSLTGLDVEPDVKISQDEFDKQMMKLAFEEGNKSSDWWRQAGSVLVKDGKVVVVVRNTHVPQDTQQYIDGDPRADFGSGNNIALSSSLHAESAAIVEAARRGISTEGTWLYATTFPCPYCAPIVAAAGVKKLFYTDGYSLIAGEEVLKSRGVEIIKVEKSNE